MDNPCLEVKNLKKIYHDKTSETLALDNINFTIKDKEWMWQKYYSWDYIKYNSKIRWKNNF